MVTPLQHADSTTRRARRFVVVVAIALVGLNLRTGLTSVTPLIAFIDNAIGFDEAAVSVLGMLPPLTLAVFGFISAPLSRRLGLEVTVVIGMVVATIGLIGRSITDNIVSFMVLTVIAMMGLGLANVLAPPLIKRYFPNRIELMTTVFTVSLVAGLGIPPMFVVSFARGYDWRWAIGIWAFGTAATALIWGFVALQKFRSRVFEPVVAKPVVETVPPKAKLPIWKSPTTWGVTALIAVNSVASFALMTWLPRLLTDAGSSVEEASLWLGMFTGGQILVFLVVPSWIGRTKHPRVSIVFFVICWMIGLAGLTFLPMNATWLWILLTRFGDACYVSGIVLMNLRTRHSSTVVRVSSFSQSTAHIAAASGALAFGQLHNLTDGWLAPMGLLFLVMPFGLIGGLLSTRPSMIEDELIKGE